MTLPLRVFATLSLAHTYHTCIPRDYDIRPTQTRPEISQQKPKTFNTTTDELFLILLMLKTEFELFVFYYFVCYIVQRKREKCRERFIVVLS